MNRLVVVLGTTHEVQNAEKYWRRVDDPQFRALLDMLVAENGIDFIFEEATGLGPTDAERLSLTLGPDRYLDVDPPRNQREKFGIPQNTNQPIHLGSPVASPPTAVCADRVFHETHGKREEFWLQQITKQDFKKALMICGQNHTLSFAFRLRAENFDVKTITYAPPLTTATQSQNGEENCARIILRHTEKAAADLEAILMAHTDKIEDVGTGIITRRLKDGSVIVCDQSGHKAPRWYERNTNEWIGEGEAGKKRLAETKGTVWVVDLSPSQFRVFETNSDAEQYIQTQLSLNLNPPNLAPTRYVDGQRQTR
jgi:hypothetical protein